MQLGNYQIFRPKTSSNGTKYRDGHHRIHHVCTGYRIAFSVLFKLAHEIQRLREKDLELAAQHGALLRRLGGVLGILQDDPRKFLQSSGGSQNAGVDREKVEELIVARNVARASKNWAESDRIRDELLGMSVVLEDGASGTNWKVKS